jgi:hypothetical protein
LISFEVAYALETAELFKQMGKSYNIEAETITFGAMSEIYSYETFLARATDKMEELLATNWRIWIFNDRIGIGEYVMKYVYDKGYRKGDFVFLTIDPVAGVNDFFVK